MRAVLLALCFVLVSLAGCADDSGADDDGDGLTNGTERQGWRVCRATMENFDCYMVTSDPKKFDTDGDGLSDRDEFFHPDPLDPRNPDTDGDGWTDCQESGLYTNCPDPNNPGELLPAIPPQYLGWPQVADADAGESRYKLFESGFQDLTGDLVNFQGDGIMDRLEAEGIQITVNGRTRTVQLNANQIDTDGDGLEDAEEIYLFGSDPLVPDTDGDGCEDGFDPFPTKAERYRVVVERVHLKRDMDPLGGADLRIVVSGLRLEGILNIPASGSIALQTGQTVETASRMPASWAPEFCQDVLAANPWIEVNMLFFDRDGDDQQLMDVWSLSGNPNTGPGMKEHAFFVNPVTMEYTWTKPRIGGSTELIPLRGGAMFIEGQDAWAELRIDVLNAS